jgi:hypothetical protein
MTLQDMVIYGLLSADILEGLDAFDGEVEKNVKCLTLSTIQEVTIKLAEQRRKSKWMGLECKSSVLTLKVS